MQETDRFLVADLASSLSCHGPHKTVGSWYAGRQICLKASFGAVDRPSAAKIESERSVAFLIRRSAYVLEPTVLAALQQHAEPLMYRCTAEVSLEQQQRGSGYIAHPAVTDNCMQLGPMTAALEASATSSTTRVVAGLAAFLARHVHVPSMSPHPGWPLQSNSAGFEELSSHMHVLCGPV